MSYVMSLHNLNSISYTFLTWSQKQLIKIDCFLKKFKALHWTPADGHKFANKLYSSIYDEK